MSKNKIIGYNPELKSLARKLRKNSTLAEILMWMNLKKKALGYEFHRQVPQARLESLGIMVVRFADADVKKSMNDVLRSLQVVISEIENKKLKQISE